jgi:hypothetical protein
LYALQRQVALASFDLADVSPVHPTHLSQLFLGPIPLLSQLTDASPESVFDVAGHASIVLA